MRKRWAIAVVVPVGLVVVLLWGVGVYRVVRPLPARPDALSAHVAATAAASGSPSSPATTTPTPTPTRTPKPSPTATPQSAYQAVLPTGPPSFSATFSGSQLNSSIWAECYPGANPAVGCTNEGNASSEYEWYLPAQDQVSGGELRIMAQRESTAGLAPDGSAKQFDCRSGIVTTFPGFHFEYGFLQVEARVPHEPGLWPALWLAAESQQWPPEMDLIESWGIDHETAAFFHPYPAAAYTAALDKGDIPVGLSTGWQTYSLYWTSSELEFFVGSTRVLVVTEDIPHQAMYFLANIAEYEPPAAGNCTGELDIRSVEYWPN